MNSGPNGSGPIPREAKNSSSAAGSKAHRRPKRRTSWKCSSRRRLEVPDEARRPLPGLGTEDELAGHAQVDDGHGRAGVAGGGRPAGRPPEAPAGLLLDRPDVHEQVLAAPPQARHPSPGEIPVQLLLGLDAHRPVVDDDLSQQQARQAGEQPAPDGLDLGELRHRLAWSVAPPLPQERPRALRVGDLAGLDLLLERVERPAHVGPGLDAEQFHHVVAAQQLRRRRLAHRRPDRARQPVVPRHRGERRLLPPRRQPVAQRHDHRLEHPRADVAPVPGQGPARQRLLARQEPEPQVLADQRPQRTRRSGC